MQLATAPAKWCEAASATPSATAGQLSALYWLLLMQSRWAWEIPATLGYWNRSRRQTRKAPSVGTRQRRAYERLTACSWRGPSNR
jgi:hypothetical protein